MVLRFLTSLFALLLVTVLVVTPVTYSIPHGTADGIFNESDSQSHMHSIDDFKWLKSAGSHNASDHEHSPYFLSSTEQISVWPLEDQIERVPVPLKAGLRLEIDRRPPRH